MGTKISKSKPKAVKGKTPKAIEDRIPEIASIIPDTKKPALIPPVRSPVLNYHEQRGRGRGAFQAAEYNLAESGRIEDSESFVRQAFDKKVGLFLKEGWDIVGPNPRTVKYIKSRLAQIARASNTPTKELIRSIASGIIRKSNTFLLKVRKTKASGGRVRTIIDSRQELEPVAAYFIIPSETVEFRLSGNKINKWRQLMPDGEYKEYSPRDVVHFYYDKKEGFVFGTPQLIPVIDDIRALRKIEENIELLVYQHLFPLFHYKVGTEDHPAGMTESGEREIDVVRREIMYMPTEGGIVTPERHEIQAIGSEGRALRAEGYLEYFKKRVIAGLGISSVDLGDGDTTNRATSDNMSRNLIDGVKDLQKIVEVIFKHEIIDELLLESTFGPEVLDEENRVELKFKEVDIDAQIKKQAHHTDMFNKDVITHDEARAELGLEPIEMPDPEESQAGTVDPSSYPEWYKTRWKMFKEPELLIQSIDEPYSPAALAAVENNSTDTNRPAIEEAGKKKNEQEITLEKEKTKAKVAVAKAKPKPPVKKKDSYINETYNFIKQDTILRIGQEQNIDVSWISQLIRAQMSPTISRLQSEQILQFRNSYIKYNSDTTDLIKAIHSARTQIKDRADKYITRLTEHLISALKKHINQNDSLQERQVRARAVFDSLEFRTRFIEDVELNKAKNLGMKRALQDKGIDTVSLVSGDDACDKCIGKSANVYDLRFLTIDNIPPHHAGCNCFIEVFTPIVDTIQDSVIISDSNNEPLLVGNGEVDKPVEELHEDDDLEACPKCNNTAILNRNTGMYRCNKCNHVFARIEDDKEVEDGASLEECVKSVKTSLRKQHPDWDADKIKSSAFSICKSKGKK